MAFSKKRVILMLTPASIDAAVVNGDKVVRADRIELDPSQWAQAWDDGLVAFDTPLASLLRRIQAANAPEIVVYTDTPTDLIDVNAYTGDAASATGAALLAAGEKMDQSDHPAPPVVRSLWTEKTEELTQSHVLTALDEDETLQKLFGWLRRGGGHLAGVVPLKAPVFEHVVARLRDASEDDVVVCYIGETCTSFAGKSKEKLAFIRAVDLGTQTLAEAYARVLGRQTSTVEMGEEGEEGSGPSAGELYGQALKLVYEQGIPSHQGHGDDRASVLSREALPLLAPVLQRLSIEIKQTVRYGMPYGHQSVKKIQLTGPGARIPGLARMLQSSLEMSVQTDDDEQGSEHQKPFAMGTTGGLSALHDADSFALLPGMAIEQKCSTRRKTALRTGALLAVALLAGEFGYLKYQQSAWDGLVAAQTQQLESTRAQSELRVQVSEMSTEFTTANFVMQDTLGDRADWYAVMGEMARLAADPIELIEFRMFYEGGTAMVYISGYAYLDGGEGGGSRVNPLGSFIDRLSQSPLFYGVQLGSTSSTEQEGRRAKQFSAQFNANAFPVQYVVPQMPAPVSPVADATLGSLTP